MASPREWRYRSGASPLDAATEMQIQQAIQKEAAAAPVSKAAAQTMAGQAAGVAGAAQAETAKADIAQDLAASTQALTQAQGLESERKAGRRLALESHRVAANRTLEALGERVDRESFNANLAFQRDELGRARFNDTQMADWAILSAKSNEDFQNKMQTAQQESERYLQVLSVAQARIAQTLQLEAKGEIAALDRDTKIQLAQAKAAIEEKIAREKANAANRMATWAAAGTIAGAVAGAVIAGPGGYAAGAALGSAVGGAAGTAVASNTNA